MGTLRGEFHSGALSPERAHETLLTSLRAGWKKSTPPYDGEGFVVHNRRVDECRHTMILKETVIHARTITSSFSSQM